MTARARSSAGCSTSPIWCSTTIWPPWRRTHAGGDPGRRPRLRPAGRRPGRRAGAGDHHRRGLPVLRHRAAEVHRGRHAGARAVHPEHGDRSVDGRCRRHPHRRPQGRADPDPPPQLSGLPAGDRHVVVAVNKLDLVDYSQEVFDADRGATTGRSPRRSGCRDVTCIPLSALRGRQHRRAQSRHALVPRADPAGPSRERSTSRTGPSRHPVPDAGPVGQPARSRLPGLLRPGRGRLGAARRPGAGPALRPQSTVARISTFDGDLDVAVAGQSVTLVLDDEIDVSRGDVLVRGRPAGGDRRPVRGPPRLDGRRRDAARAALPAQARHVAGRRHLLPAQVQGERQHAGAPGGADAGAERDRCVHGQHRPHGAVRPLRVEPRHGRLRHHRPADQRHRGGRSSPLLAPALAERSLAGHGGRPGRHATP